MGQGDIMSTLTKINSDDDNYYDFILPRVIIGNRGDLLSRYGIIQLLKTLSSRICVFCKSEQDLLDLGVPCLKYRKFHNFFMSRAQKRALKRTGIVVWGAGLDMQDESGLFKLLYLIFWFTYYRALNKKVVVLCQGAGPLESGIAKFLASIVIKKTDLIVARDSQSYKLLRSINHKKVIESASDGIFLGKIDFASIEKKEREYIDSMFLRKELSVGFNIRLWYHLKSGLLPYQFSRKSSLRRAAPLMEKLVDSSSRLIDNLLEKHNCSVFLISAYQPGEYTSEDDMIWLDMIRKKSDNEKIILIKEKMSLLAYLYLMSKLDLMIGVRLHSALTAVRLNVPSINLSYTLKGKSIFSDMGLSEYVFELSEFIKDPFIIADKVAAMLSNLESEKLKFKQISNDIVKKNSEIIKACMQEVME